MTGSGNPVSNTEFGRCVQNRTNKFYLCESLIWLECPDALWVGMEGGDTALLAQWPQPDRPVAASGQALRTVPVQNQGLVQRSNNIKPPKLSFL